MTQPEHVRLEAAARALLADIDDCRNATGSVAELRNVVAALALASGQATAISCSPDLPAIAPGHWSTEDGRDMARAALDDRYMATARARISDFALANAVFLDPSIMNLTDAKERIRWLSAMVASSTAGRL